MTLQRTLFAAGVSLLLTSQSIAAPFCVQVTGIPDQCLYVDPGQCQNEAQRQKGQCIANAAEIKAPPRAQAFCLVTSGSVLSCIYPDRADCDKDSARLKGACMPALPTPSEVPAPPPGVDPYQVKRPY
ncbi:MAG TPA: hypothetical protein VKP60_05585 [Magnetospirillaceae bacterium]|nr:hypothetical protein [Magnetospirillaceae bacterium]